MGDKSTIEWTDATWTPVRARNTKTGKTGWHCEHKSEACRNCYAEALNLRLGTKLLFKPGLLKNGDVSLFLDVAMLVQPIRWQKPREIFVCSMTDLFGSFVARQWIVDVFAIMALAERHQFQVLTKRPDRMSELTNDPTFVAEVDKAMDELAPAHWCKRELEDVGGWPLKNVMLGGSAGDQAEADQVVPHVLNASAARRFLSYEPAIGYLDLTNIDYGGWRLDALRGTCEPHTMSFPHLDWVIAGGESSSAARAPSPFWFRDLRDQCAEAGVPFFFKQWGEWAPGVKDGNDDWMIRVGKKAAGANLDGREHRERPRRADD